jgi:hypothetical protein
MRALGLVIVMTLARTVAGADTPVHRAVGPIIIDGDLSDRGWSGAALIDHFYEISPGDAAPPKVSTAVLLAYDEKYFYVGVRADDPRPSRIRAPFVERDAAMDADDYLAVFIDSRNDRRSAIELRVNPRGIQADAIFNDANQNEAFSPDFFYDTATRITAKGWSAEFRIPFSSLRYSDANPQSWGILIVRNYPRDFTYTIASAPIPRTSGCKICYAHEITDLRDLPKVAHVVAAPYVTLQRKQEAVKGVGSRLEIRPVRTETGGDVKWTPTADQAMDLTVNPDFSQVESDVARITVNQRFALDYPEKRPFFLEGFDLFDTPIKVAYTRSITSPRWGLRGSGKIGSTAYTALVTEDRGGGVVILPSPTSSSVAAQDFRSKAIIARTRHDICDIAFAGVILTDREISGGGHNRVIGPDFQWRKETNSVTGQILYADTRTPNRPDLSSEWNGRPLHSWAGQVVWAHNAPFDWLVMAKTVGTAFRADNGFLPQVGIRELKVITGRRWSLSHGPLSTIRPYGNIDVQTDQRGATVHRVTIGGIYLEGVRGLKVTLAGYFHDRYRVLGLLPEQSYFVWSVEAAPSRYLPQILFKGRTGESIDFVEGRVGHGSSITIAMTTRPTDRLTLDIRSEEERLDIAAGRLFTARVQRLKAIYSFSARSLIRLIAQYTPTKSNPALYSAETSAHSGSFDGSVLYSFRLNPQTVFFAGYGDDRVLTERNVLKREARSLFLKISYALQR